MSFGISARILSLVIAAIATMAAANFIITFNGPPPFRAPVSIDRALELALAGQSDPRDQIDYRLSGSLPRREAGQILDKRAASAAAAKANLPEGSIVIYREQYRGPRSVKELGELRGSFSLSVRKSDGWHIVSMPKEPLLTAWHLNVGALTLAVAVLLSLIAILFARAITKPITRLAHDADTALIEGPPILASLRAPPEIGKLANALENMRIRHAAVVNSRTDLLVGIAHDLGTPLTRLAFRVEQLPPDSRAEAIHDITQMRGLIRAAMDYARGSGDAREIVEVDVLVRDLVARYGSTEAPVILGACMAAVINGNEMALARMIANLIENAQRYAGSAEVEVIADIAMVRIAVKDRGPGFDPDIADRLFEPFFRVEDSRNENTGGTGLGLAVARSIAEKHGGKITACNRPGGGAEFVISLPLEGPVPS